MIAKTERRRSIEVASIYRVRNAQRVEDTASESFRLAPTRENLDEWNRAIRFVKCARLMRTAATRRTITHARHALSLAELRSGVDAYATYREVPPGSCDQLANDRPLALTAEHVHAIEEPRTFSLSLDELSLDEVGANAPPLVGRSTHPFTGGPPT